MFDKNFAIRRDFANDPERLKRRLRMVGVGMALVSPFLVVFMLMYFFMRNAEQFYHQPGTVGSRRWSNLAKWRLREFNEVGCQE
jgi:autophagy-related protein 9